MVTRDPETTCDRIWSEVWAELDTEINQLIDTEINQLKFTLNWILTIVGLTAVADAAILIQLL